ncbi:MAG TPA: Rne/Rng family ribonuclease [Alphaproteobacteria bacterium]|nr:Rne/Rng family ribonuclease [Alphaproteobacteria bacterium]
MIDEILVSVSPGETRIACLEHGRATELHRFLHGRSTTVGNIYLGRITRVVPGMGAAFVEFGAPKAGFLPLPAESAARAALHEGARVLIQVLREPERGKGAQVSTTIRLAGHLLVYVPTGDGPHVSRRIGDEREIARLVDVVRGITAPGEGWIVRTNATGATPEEFAREAATLRSLWTDIQARASRGSPPAVVHAEPSPVVRILRDKVSPEVRRIAVDDGEAYTEAATFLKTYRPELVSALVSHRGGVPLFELDGVEVEFDAVRQRRVALPSGGTLAIERTEALWAIDVNTARNVSGASAQATILATNLEAATEIARQIRLRDLGGLIVVDFVHMDDDPVGRNEVLDTLRRAMVDDPSPARMAGFSELGLIEMSRRRVRPAMDEDLLAVCGRCEGTGFVQVPLATALAAFREAARGAPRAPIRIAVSASVAAAMDSPEAAAGRDELARRVGQPVDIVVDSTLAADRFRVE